MSSVGTVLIIEDDRDLLCALSEMLEAGGWRVIGAHSAAEGFVAVRAHRVDVVLTDVLMPQQDGREVAARLRADPALASIPVVFMTASQRHARDLAGETVIPKPFEVSVLLEVLARQLPTG